jgi:amidase
MIGPVWTRPSFGHGADLDEMQFLDWIRPVLPANLLGTPAAVTPAGIVDGLPVGVQVMGDRFTDHRCLTVAAEIESLAGTFTPIDPVTG